jgi:hypothetical protein
MTDHRMGGSVKRSRIRENSDVFSVAAPNSHESGYNGTSRFAPRSVVRGADFSRHEGLVCTGKLAEASTTS